MPIFRLLSLLLRYPDEELLAALPEIARLLESEHGLPAPCRQALLALIEELAAGPPLAVQARYVELFDRGRQLSLHVFEHTHGESRERGPAMNQLLGHYQA